MACDTYPKDPDQLRCWVCGAMVSDPENVGWKKTEPPEIIAEGKPKWRAAWERFYKTRNPLQDSFALQLPASEVDTAAFPFDDAWLPLCRLILVYKDKNNRPSRHQISGIAYIPGAKRDKRFIVVPKDSQRAYIGAPEPIMSQCLQATPVAHPFDTSTVKPGDLEGYTIHSRCWTLIQKGLGKEGEVRLDVVIKTLRCRWKELFPYLLRYLPEVKNGDSDGLIGKNIEDDYKRLIQRSDCAGVYPWPESDPIHIYELRTIIRKAYESRRSQRMIRNPRPVSLLSTKYGVPLEILCLIGEYLDTNELRNMTIALNEQFPVSFWRGQIPDIFFEIDNIRADRMNWSFLAVLARSDFVQESDGVLNRRRLLDMIRPRKEDRDI